jgi:hypothetical protein
VAVGIVLYRNIKCLGVTTCGGLKPNYTCEICSQIFRRKWNFRKHGKIRHGFDPFPASLPVPSQLSNKNKTDLSMAIGRLTAVMGNYFRAKELGMTMIESALFAQLRDSPAHLLDLLAHRFIIVDKNEIKGLSGYICPYCFAFELRHIRDLGYDKVASELHICAPEKKAEARMSLDPNNTKIGVHNEALKCLRLLTRNLFHEPRLVVEKYDERLKTEKFHGPLVILNQLERSHWAWVPLFYRGLHLDENHLTEFLNRTGLSTFILITVLKGDFAGNYLLSIK